MSGSVDKTDPSDCHRVYADFNHIRASLPAGALITYTDGSVIQGDEAVPSSGGSGFVVFSKNKKITRGHVPMRTKDVNITEMSAVLLLLQFLPDADIRTRDVHNFIDSKRPKMFCWNLV